MLKTLKKRFSDLNRQIKDSNLEKLEIQDKNQILQKELKMKDLLITKMDEKLQSVDS